MKKIGFLLVFISAFTLSAQIETVTGYSFFRDKSEHPNYIKGEQAICDVSFQKDTIKKSFTKKLKSYFMENYLFEVHDGNINLFVSPVVNFQLGKNLVGEDEPYLFQNSRGFYVKGSLLKNFSFCSAFVENQARFSVYETDYIARHGEFYSTLQQNGVVPGEVERNHLRMAAMITLMRLAHFSTNQSSHWKSVQEMLKNLLVRVIVRYYYLTIAINHPI